MKLLLDTHTFIWWSGSSGKLSEKVLVACEDNNNSLIFECGKRMGNADQDAAWQIKAETFLEVLD